MENNPPTGEKPARRPYERNPNPDSQIRYVDWLERRTETILSGLPESLQQNLRMALEERRLNNRKPSSNLGWAKAWGRAYLTLGARNPASLSAAEWRSTVHSWLSVPGRNGKGVVQRSTVSQWAANVKCTLHHFYPNGDVPADIKKALIVKLPPHRPKGRVITDAEFNALLEQATTENTSSGPRQITLKVALLWCMWDSGTRISELLGLNLSDVVLLGDAAQLRMREDAPLLKTGARTVNLIEAVPALTAWLQMHPAAGDLTAPLFCNLRDQQGRYRMSKDRAEQMVRRWGDAGGLNPPGKKPISPHDFRHTRATRIARQKWDPALKEKFFGWAPGSAMASYYSHIADEDILDQIRRDLGVDTIGFPTLAKGGDYRELLREIFKQFMEREGTGATRKAKDWERT